MTLSTARTVGRGQHPLAGPRIDAAVRERRGHHREAERVDHDRALARSSARARRRGRRRGPRTRAAGAPIARLRWPVSRSDSKTAGSIANGRPAAPPSTSATIRSSAATPSAGAHQRRGGDRAGVDHRVERHAAARRERDRVEGVAGRLDPDPAAHRRLAEVVEDQPVGERLRDRLDGERLPAVADLVAGAVHGHQRDPEPGRVGEGQRRDVASRPRRPSSSRWRSWSRSR